MEYIPHTIRWAKLAGFPCVHATGDCFLQLALSDREVLDTGTAVSQCVIGEGANAENVRNCINILSAAGYSGVLRIECEGQRGPMSERSLDWVPETVKQAEVAPGR